MILTELRMNSFYSGKLSKVASQALYEEKHRTTIALTKQEKEYNKTAWPDDRISPSLSSFKIDLSFLPKDFKYNNDLDINLNLEGMKVQSYSSGYSETDINIRYFSKVIEGKYINQGIYDGHSNTSLLFGNQSKENILIINFSKEEYKKINQYHNNN
ncbi:hypothetical protein [Flavobacterium sp. CS20]|uniref:hypothetical protein n=1 Tax=Flavobacterium sp. CS20 TaxID=2775246 RepID=UPI001B3A5CA0|nr:hypothetical protein [Flavobacterium sp. CS20]QTY26804.1 hypothetical protein IGB25_13145 [Flavobacterium sp. CS20]